MGKRKSASEPAAEGLTAEQVGTAERVAAAEREEAQRRACRVLELRVVETFDVPDAPIVRGAADLEPALRRFLDGLTREQFWVVLLDAKNRPTAFHRVSEGCLTWSVVHPREVFAVAVRECAGAVIVAHNHPSGDPTPSPQDVEVTARLARVGETLGIPLLDHIVVGRRRCVSMRAQGLLPAGAT